MHKPRATHGGGGEFPEDLTCRPQHNGGVNMWGANRQSGIARVPPDLICASLCAGWQRAGGAVHLSWTGLATARLDPSATGRRCTCCHATYVRVHVVIPERAFRARTGWLKLFLGPEDVYPPKHAHAHSHTHTHFTSKNYSFFLYFNFKIPLNF